MVRLCTATDGSIKKASCKHVAVPVAISPAKTHLAVNIPQYGYHKCPNKESMSNLVVDFLRIKMVSEC